jgi:SpoVK/Ycf46/Vps4 family AAA+-type ATPase
MDFKTDLRNFKIDKNELFFVDFPTIRIYNLNSASDHIFILIKKNNISFGLEYDTFIDFRNNILDFSIRDMKEDWNEESRPSSTEKNKEKKNYDKFIHIVEPKNSFQTLFFDKRTKKRIDEFVTIIENKDLIFKKWGLRKLNRDNEQLFAFFTGSPGTGKTAVAEAIAKKFNKKLLSINIANLINQYFGESEKNVTKVFKNYSSKDVLLLFDEADALLSTRTTSNEHANLNSVKNVLLQEIERYSGVIIFTSNLACNIDPAFERRIQFMIEIGNPDKRVRIKILKSLVNQTTAPFPKRIDYEAICKYELTGSDLKNVVLAAATRGAQRSNKKITNKDLIDSAKQIILGKQYFKTSYIGKTLDDQSKVKINYIA